MASGTTLSLTLSGCSGGGDTTTDDGSSDATTVENADTTTANEDGDATTSGGETTEPAKSSKGTFAVKVVYDGEWQGSISADGSSKSIQGTGPKTVEVKGNPSIISANAQKKDKGAGKDLTVKILRDGEILEESSTEAEYGLAQVTASEYNSESSGSQSGGAKLSVEVVYDGEWQGSISGDGSSRSVQGTGPKTLEVKGSPSIVSANAQKKDKGAGKKLSINIMKDGEILKESSTTADYGMAQVTASV
ncbi:MULTISPECIES: hypothetical protein [Halorussus]|uniref:hypothetical protein n=1 Tax=Halorussus TaxID=1070314 RepID=UPI0020A008A0|nr:hypothetical protein [Halorussus vallis]USZ77638.1 hypothetical protein NGM07_09945 [Halorussus vallis]